MYPSSRSIDPFLAIESSINSLFLDRMKETVFWSTYLSKIYEIMMDEHKKKDQGTVRKGNFSVVILCSYVGSLF
jgi:hypothetical protein